MPTILRSYSKGKTIILLPPPTPGWETLIVYHRLHPEWLFCLVTPQFVGTQIYFWLDRGTVRVKWLYCSLCKNSAQWVIKLVCNTRPLLGLHVCFLSSYKTFILGAPLSLKHLSFSPPILENCLGKWLSHGLTLWNVGSSVLSDTSHW